MPTSLTITVRYLDGSIETFTNCVVSVDTDDKIEFSGSISGGPATDTHKIMIAKGMRISRRTS
jgi:hypothetical protein